MTLKRNSSRSVVSSFAQITTNKTYQSILLIGDGLLLASQTSNWRWPPPRLTAIQLEMASSSPHSHPIGDGLLLLSQPSNPPTFSSRTF